MAASAGSTPASTDCSSDSSGAAYLIATGSEDAVFHERYQCLFGIGRGGMGSVEVALDRCPDGSQRIVALKRLLPESARDPRRTEMFLREARLAAMLLHPNVVHAFAFGENNGELFLSMEYVEGESLSSVLTAARESGYPLSPTLVATILAEVCDGLHAAHELRNESGEPLNVVHRDVSPHNVMIGFEGVVKVLDFGVAKFEAASQQTRTGEVKGKMAYMSPEQALGDGLDRRSDLFSVGAVLFECLAGRRMWGSGTDLEVMRRLALQDPPSLAQAVEGVPPALLTLFARLTARDRSVRPENARDVAVALRAFAAEMGEPACAPPVKALMDRLFRGEADSRRKLLASAIAQTTQIPSGASPVRRTLEPFAIGTTPKPGLYEVTTSSRNPRALRPVRRGWPTPPTLAIIAAAGVLVGAAGLAGILALRGPVHSPTAVQATSVPAPPAFAVNVSAPAPATPALQPSLSMPAAKVDAENTTPVLARAPATAPSTAATAAEPPTPAALPGRPPSRPPAPRTPAKMPDVDPTPF
jgi:serine/threonine protein kinase